MQFCREAGLLDANQVVILFIAHAELLLRTPARILDLTLHIAPRNTELKALCGEVMYVTQALGFAFA
ncbi:hypothetical protein [Rhodanobacter sp. 7MK24]|uniref:hypothetical protein n=1 Tax=Rhodanobacter sp. 7MK24 TaxID=2775922 RepID=UPI00177B9F74|nr:hypothetical protein [Rhodanobacter sp. 7MK24]